MEAKNGDRDKKSTNDIVVVISGVESTSKAPDSSEETSIRTTSSLTRSKFSKPKSRLMEPSYPTDSELKALKNAKPTAKNNVSTNSCLALQENTAKVAGSVVFQEEEDDEEVYKSASLQVHQTMTKKLKRLVCFEWTVFLLIMTLLIASLTVHKLLDLEIWGLELWKWTLLILVIFCGRLVTGWLINLLVFLIGKSYLVNKKFLYFVYGLKRSVQVFIWLGLVLLAWALLMNHGVERPRNTKRILNYVTRAIGSCLIGSAIWLVKTFLIKLLASSFQCMRFFDRIQESFYHQFIVRVLSGPPLINEDDNIGSTKLKYQKVESSEKKEEVIDIVKLSKLKQEMVSAWTMNGLVDAISGSAFSFPDPDEDEDEEGQKKDTEITSEWGAKAAAYSVFKNVAKPGYKYIEKEDLLVFLKKEDVDNVFPLFEGAETGKVKRSALKNWLVKVYVERKSLAHSLNDTKTAIEELNKLVSGLVLIVIIVIWLLVMGLLTTQVLLLIGSQLLLVAFMFGNTAKTVFEAIIFVFVMHPYDVGDRCVIDGVQMVVEEMNILSTVFLRYDNEKIYYPNSVLAMKPISNFYRSPEMSDSVEFAVDFTTSVENIGVLKARIKGYLESKPKYWRPTHSVLVKEIVDVNKMKMALYITHTINFQNSADRNSRRSELVLELKKMFEELGICYHLLPQEVQVSYAGAI